MTVYVKTVPAMTGLGVWLLVTARSACVPIAVEAVPVLLAGKTSTTPGVARVAVALSVMFVPLGVLALTRKMSVTVALLPLASGPSVPVTVPMGVTVTPVRPVDVTKVLLAGMVSVRVTLGALSGPLLVTVTV